MAYSNLCLIISKAIKPAEHLFEYLASCAQMSAERYVVLHVTCPYLTKPEIQTGQVKCLTFSLEQVMKAQRWSISIAVLFL
jgi:hypothetical protein